MRKSGGENKTHGQIERADRIDSFEAGTVDTVRMEGRQRYYRAGVPAWNRVRAGAGDHRAVLFGEPVEGDTGIDPDK